LAPKTPEGLRVSPRSLYADRTIPIEPKYLVLHIPNTVTWGADPAPAPKPEPAPEMPWEGQCLAACDYCSDYCALCQDYCRREGKKELQFFLNKGVDSMRRGNFPSCCIGHTLGCGRAIYRCYHKPSHERKALCKEECTDCLKACCICSVKTTFQAAFVGCAIIAPTWSCCIQPICFPSDGNCAPNTGAICPCDCPF